MSIFSLSQETVSDAANDNPAQRTELLIKIRRALCHPSRIRILDHLMKGHGLTQHELGARLLMSNAAVHYHVKQLAAVELVRFTETRPGPNGIVERILEANMPLWRSLFDSSFRMVDLGFYLDYTIAWMQERNREGAEILKHDGYDRILYAGSFVARAPRDKIAALKQTIERELTQFFDTYSTGKNSEGETVALTFSVLPSSDDNSADSRNILDHEPGPSATSTRPVRRRKASTKQHDT